MIEMTCSGRCDVLLALTGLELRAYACTTGHPPTAQWLFVVHVAVPWRNCLARNTTAHSNNRLLLSSMRSCKTAKPVLPAREAR